MKLFLPLISLLSTALLSLALTPVDFRIAERLGAIDVPRDKRRMHKKPTPRLGGLSIFAAFLATNLIFSMEIASDLFYAWSGAILVLTVGVLDDMLSLPPLLKLFAQSGAALVSMLGGNFMGELRLLGKSFALGMFGIPLTLLFLLTLINAHNFIDGLDGLCAGVSLSESLAVGLLLTSTNALPFAAVAMSLGGACIGFLPYNVRGAKLFMGDTGSTFLGFMSGFLAIKATSSALVLLLVFAIPLADITFAITRRVMKGQNPLLPDRSHLHHLLADRIGAYGASKTLVYTAALYAALAVLIH